MSHVIPMVSSSPPPLDEGPSFADAWDDNDDDDDFGNFTGADISNDTQDFNHCALPSPKKDPSADSITDSFTKDEENGIKKSELLDKDAESLNNCAKINNVESQNSDSVLKNVSETDNIDIASEETEKSCDTQGKPSTLDLPFTTSDLSGQRETTGGSEAVDLTNSMTSSTHSKRASTTDSGMFSTEISPIPLSEETGEFSESKNTDTDTDEMFTENESSDCTDHLNSAQSTKETRPETPDSHLNDDALTMSNAIDQPISIISENKGMELSEEINASPDDDESCEECDNSWSDFSEPNHLSEKLPTDFPRTDSPVDKFSTPETTSVETSSTCNSKTEESGVSNNDEVNNILKNDTEFNSDSLQSESENPDNNLKTGFAEFPESNSESQTDNWADFASVSDAKFEDEIQQEVTSLTEPETMEKKSIVDNESEREEDFSDLKANDVNEFQTTNADDNDEFGDFDNFDEFQTTKPDDCEKDDLKTNDFKEFQTTNADENDEFGDFDNFDEYQTTKPEDCDEDEFGDFDNFSEFQTPKPVDNRDHVEDDFGDFSDFSQAQDIPTKTVTTTTVKALPPSAISQGKLKAPVQEKVSGVIQSCFPAKNTEPVSLNQLNEVLDNLMENSRNISVRLPKQQKHIPTQPVSSEKVVENIWPCLRDIEKSTALKYQWSESSGNKKLFKTLKIDARNVLMWGTKKPGIPLYAAQLGLLEPTRGDLKQSEESQKVVTSLVDTTKTDSNTVTQEIPPAQFDWSGSGLTNPLDAQSTLLDLGLLAMNDGKADGDKKGKVFESDILGGTEKLSVAPKTLQPLETVLASMKFNPTIKTVKTDEKLSEEAARIINTLPNLSFMQARVLMFPVRSVAE